MKLNHKRLGNYIKLVDERNSDLHIGNLLGVNMTKNYMPTVANMSDLDLSRYKIVRKGRFACNIMHVGRDERLPISLFTEMSPAIVSPAYMTFEIKNSEELLPEFLMMIFQQSEFDRFAWFISDSSIRGGLEWDRFCEIEVPIPETIDEQKKYVSIYNGLLSNQLSYEKGLNDLQFACDSFMEALVIKEGTKILGDYIQQSDVKNRDLSLSYLRGVSITKELIKSKANMTDVGLSNYKIVKNGQFVFNPNTARMGEKIPIALNKGKECIVSQIYPVFEIKKDVRLLPEFLFLWFKRAEFDRYARFHSWGSARETFDWTEMCNVRLPIPEIEVQESIVAMHHALETRKRINSKLKEMIVPLCPILMRGVINNLPIVSSPN